MEEIVFDVKQNLSDVVSRIRAAERRAGRKEGEVKLLAVSKFHSERKISLLADAGQVLFGENRVQEAREKFIPIKSLRPNVKLHIIGQLQTNKVKKAVEVADCIESVDRIPLLQEIEKRCSELGRNIQVFLELHTAEDSKSGFSDVDEARKALAMFGEGLFPHVEPKGFMTMAPFTEDEGAVRRSFSTLRETASALRREFPFLPLDELSMGMSGDFEKAIEEGSTLVRIGTAIFGGRDYGAK